MVCELLTAVASLVGGHRLQGSGASVVAACGLSVVASGTWSTGSVVVVHRLSCSQHVGSSRTGDQPCISCTGRQIPYHWAPREALSMFQSLVFHTRMWWERPRSRGLGAGSPQSLFWLCHPELWGLRWAPQLSWTVSSPQNALLLDCSPPRFSVHAISEARIREWVPFPSLQDSVLKIFSPGLWFSWRKGDPFQGLGVGPCLTLGNELSEETSAVQARDFIVKGCRGGRQEHEGNREPLPSSSQSQVLWLLG